MVWVRTALACAECGGRVSESASAAIRRIANRPMDARVWRNTPSPDGGARRAKGGQDFLPPTFFDRVAIGPVFLEEWCRALSLNHLVGDHRGWGGAARCREDPTVYRNDIVNCQP